MLRADTVLTAHEKAVADIIKKIEKGEAQESDLDYLLDTKGAELPKKEK